MSMYFVQLRIAPQNPKTPSCVSNNCFNLLNGRPKSRSFRRTPQSKFYIFSKLLLERAVIAK